MDAAYFFYFFIRGFTQKRSAKKRSRVKCVRTQQEADYSAVEKISADELMELIAQLPPGFRTVFNMFAIEGYSHREIAETLNINESTSRSQYTRAKRLLQKWIKELK